MVFFLVKTGGNFGIGHLKRVLNLMELTRRAGKTYYITLMSDESPKEYHRIMNGVRSGFIPMNDVDDLDMLIEQQLPDVAVLDGREFDPDIYERFISRNIPMISLDDYEYGREIAEVSLSPLPYHEKKYANFEDVKYTPFNESLLLRIGHVEPYRVKPAKNVLISFGGSDPENIAKLVVDSLIDEDYRLTLVEGPLADYQWVYDYHDVEVLHSPDQLTPHIEQNDVVITTVGMTLVEALALNRKVIAINPSPYHDLIARQIPLVVNVGYYEVTSAQEIRDAIDAIPAFGNIPRFMNYQLYSAWWVGLLDRVQSHRNANCPLCGSVRRHVLYRTESYTLFECRSCRSNYQYPLKAEPDYDRDYFEADYKERYGLTYAEDEQNIRAYGRRRLKRIIGMLPSDGKRLLDVGAGLGIFLDESGRMGFDPTGVEISEYARKYAVEHWNVPILPGFELTDQQFEAITMWFSLEHQCDPSEWLRTANLHLSEGSILALGLPNARGAFARWNRPDYLEKRPEDHCWEPSPQGLKILLNRYGFKIEKMIYFGLHPERIGLPNNALFRKLQQHLKLGDTFEIYARKISTPSVVGKP